MSEYRDKLVEMVKAVGQELVEKADEIVGHKDCTTDFNIVINIGTATDHGMNEVPTIEVTQTYISRKAMETMIPVVDVAKKEE